MKCDVNKLQTACSCMLFVVMAYEPVHSLRSLSRGLLSVPEARLETGGDRALAVRASKLRNELPEEIRSAESLTSFKSLLKTHRTFNRKLSWFYLIFINWSFSSDTVIALNCFSFFLLNKKVFMICLLWSCEALCILGLEKSSMIAGIIIVIFSLVWFGFLT